ncbi:MAG: DUF4145 domain-containing protein [Sphingomonas sp.]|uniref:DUF4145 domain-containing protein n=1 Tax=Sphingomonas sp. TaxID=28214 RepID=UPI0025F80E7D|nr:DUF4145 domain-containing protein [Sphingomonas sp.]MBX9881698.1 DUF4145 domain-containing protein [Sphingomonas sp.]
MFDKFERITILDERKRLQCNDCRRETIHVLEARCHGSWETEHNVEGMISGATIFSLFRCGACDAVCFEKDSWDSQCFAHDEYGQMYAIHEFAHFPPPSSADFSFDTSHVSRRLSELIDEMMYCLVGGKLNLATIGLRLIIEFIVNDAHCGGRTLEKKIDNLCINNNIDDVQKELLHTIRKKGNAGAHKGIAMTRNEMIAGMTIVSLLLEKLYNGPARQADAIAKAQKAFKAQ